MTSVNIVYGSFVTLLSFTLINSQLESPCPSVFEYRYGTANNPNELYGLIQAPIPQDNSNVIKLEVQISVGNTVQGYNGNIQLGAPRTEILSDLMNNRPLRYVLYFPPWVNIIPRVTRILINGRQVCSGNPIESSSVPVVTTVSLQHSLTIANANGLQSQDNVSPLSHSFGTPTRAVATATAQAQPSFHFVLGAPPGQGMPSNFNINKNPFINQIFPGNQQGFGAIFGNNQQTNFPFFGQNNPFLPTNPQPQTPPQEVPSIPNKSGVDNIDENWSYTPKTKQVDSLPPIESNAVTQSSSDVCGISVNSNNLLINGNRFARNLHPWLAALFMQNDEGLKFMCGTTLISQKHVVTAAHCVHSRRKKFNPEELWVVLGRENIQKWSNDGAQIIQAESIHYYPDHQFHTADADIAVLVLSEEVTFTPLVRPACVWNSNPSENLIVGQNGTVIGWGKDEQGRVFTPQPRLVTMPVVSEETCLRSNAGFREITSNRTFCAGNRDASGPCNGDSGSGFLLKKLGRWYLRGVVSMSLLGSDGNCDLRQYIVFTDAAKYTEWIRSFLRQ